jgi:hypothetical protein
MCVLETLEQLALAADCRGVAAQERAARAMAAAVRTSELSKAAWVYSAAHSVAHELASAVFTTASRSAAHTAHHA